MNKNSLQIRFNSYYELPIKRYDVCNENNIKLLQTNLPFVQAAIFYQLNVFLRFSQRNNAIVNNSQSLYTHYVQSLQTRTIFIRR